MAANITDKFTQATNGSRPSATTLTALHSGGDTTMACAALNGWPTATAVHFIVYTTDTGGNKVAGSQTDWKGVVSGTNLVNCQLKAGTDSGYSIGAIVEAAPTAYWAKDMADGILVEHDQDGTHGVVTATSLDATSVTATTATFTNLNVTGTATSQGWTPLGDVPDTVTANGNRNYDIVFNGVDHTSTLSPGMKLQLTRTVAAPYRCTDLESGSSQYYSKSSPSGLSFTTTFTCSAWVKLESYTAGGIMARRNADTEGWSMYILSTGQVHIGAFRIAGNNKVGQSYASIPLNKWVHVAASMDVSVAGDASTNIYIDGVLVPSYVTTNGTCTALVQGTTALVIGAGKSAGTDPFDGKIAQAAVYSAVLSATTIKNSMDRTLSGSETNLVSAYSFDNSINDLNANANNLTAQGSAVATNADSPFANAVAAGLLEYAEVNSVAFSTNTTVNVRVPDTCQIPTSGGVSAVSYSTQSNPFGLPYGTKLLQKVGLPAFSTTSTSAVQMNGASLITVVPAGGTVKVILYTQELLLTAGGAYAYMGIWSGTVGSGTLLTQASTNNGSAVNVASAVTAVATYTNPSPTSSASVTFNGSLYSGSGARTATTAGGSIAAQYMSVELV